MATCSKLPTVAVPAHTCQPVEHGYPTLTMCLVGNAHSSHHMHAHMPQEACTPKRFPCPFHPAPPHYRQLTAPRFAVPYSLSGPIRIVDENGEPARPGDLLAVELCNLGPLLGDEWGYTGKELQRRAPDLPTEQLTMSTSRG